MIKRAIRKVFNVLGVDINLYNRNLDTYQKLYKKYGSFTMIPRDFFIDNLDLCNVNKDVQGDFVECGVWRGGMSAAIAEILGKDRMIHLFDSFEGLPPAKDIDGANALTWQQDTTSQEYFDNCKAEESFAIQAFKMADHQNYKLYKGWFDKTLPGSVNTPIAILRLDGDWYDSILDCLENLYPLVTEGGIIILDDYHTWDGCAKAVHDYLSKAKSPARVHQWNNRIAYIIKRS